MLGDTDVNFGEDAGWYQLERSCILSIRRTHQPFNMTDRDIKYESLPAYEQVDTVANSTEETLDQTMARRAGSQRLLRIVFVALAAVFLMKGLFVSYHHCMRPAARIHPPHRPFQWETEDDWVLVEKNSTKVPLEAHIMSKCPDAKYCLEKLVVPTMEKVHDKVNFTLSFIGRLDPHSDAVSCMHGPGECLGNIILLCAQKLYPDPKIHLGYANCMISDYKNIPERDLVEGCAMEHGIDFAKINKCISDDGGEGVGLLRDSIERSSENNVTKSCTVRINGETRCIRDGGEWKDCEGGSSVDDLVKDIEKAYDSAKS